MNTQKLSSPIRYHHYALLHSGGLALCFDMMRYDSAFLVLQADVDRFMESAGNHILTPYSVLLGKYSYSSRPDWTHARLMSTQEYDELNDQTTIYKLYPNFAGFKITHPLKWRSECEVTGNLRYILQTMLLNHAFPAIEDHAGAIEGAFYHPELKVMLARYTTTAQIEWKRGCELLFINVEKSVKTSTKNLDFFDLEGV